MVEVYANPMRMAQGALVDIAIMVSAQITLEVLPIAVRKLTVNMFHDSSPYFHRLATSWGILDC